VKSIRTSGTHQNRHTALQRIPFSKPLLPLLGERIFLPGFFSFEVFDPVEKKPAATGLTIWRRILFQFYAQRAFVRGLTTGVYFFGWLVHLSDHLESHYYGGHD